MKARIKYEGKFYKFRGRWKGGYIYSYKNLRIIVDQEEKIIREYQLSEASTGF